MHAAAEDLHDIAVTLIRLGADMNLCNEVSWLCVWRGVRYDDRKRAIEVVCSIAPFWSVYFHNYVLL